MLIFASRNVWLKRGISSLAVLGVGLGLALMTFLLSISAGLGHRLATTYAELAGRMVVSPQDAIFGGLFFNTGTPLAQSDLQIIERIPRVKKAYGRISASLRLDRDPVMILPLTGYTREEINSCADTPFAKIISGRAPLNDNEIAIGNRLKETLKYMDQDLGTGETYPFIIAGNQGSGGINLKLTGVFETGNEITDTSFCSLTDLARKLTNLPLGRMSSINVQLSRPEDVPAVEKEILDRFSEENRAIQVVVPKNILNPLQSTLKTVNRFLFFISCVCGLAGALFIAIIMSASVLERKKEFAVLKSVGWRGRHIVVLVLIESLVLSGCGAALGLVLGYAGTILAKHYISPDITLISGPVILPVAAAGILTGALGGLYPAWRAKLASPAEIFRQG